jgi:hypothetical protein
MSWKVLVCVLVSVVRTLSVALAAEQIVPPAVPPALTVPDAFKPFLKAHAVGTQNYICAPAATPSGFDWLFIGPQATLFDDDLGQSLTHFQSVNAFQNAIQATWQHSRDSSVVWAAKHSGATVTPDAIEWLLLDVTGTELGPTGGDKLARTTYVQRVNTVGGVKPPSTECGSSTLNTRRLVPYQADYYFYR